VPSSLAFLAPLASLVDRECVSPRCLGVEMSTRTDGLPLGSHPYLATTRSPAARMISPVIQADWSDARTRKALLPPPDASRRSN
jgi:hypothetical protein